INDVFFSISVFLTIIAMGMMIMEFFSRGLFPPTMIETFYIGILSVYSLHKEALRWIGEKGDYPQQKKGEYFVYVWIAITATLYLINFFTRNYFSFSATGEKLTTLSEICLTTLEVAGVFIFTRLIKIATVYFLREKKS
ncbi:MAG: hypothetical protein V1841_01185, partial [Patescibacteria group bacterium]